MLTEVRQYIEAEGLFPQASHVVVACSGGPDSVALTHVLAALRPLLSLRLTVASVDHGLREESAQEVAWVGRFAASLELPFEPLRVQVQRNDSLQNAARRARYRALFELRDRIGAAFIATGHTLDDQAETLVGRVLRGAGLRGLRGIHPRRADGVVRPLLGTTRALVRDYLTRRELRFLSDPSNCDERFERVRLRTKVIPLLQAEDPRLLQHLGQLAVEARQATAFLETQAEAFLNNHACLVEGYEDLVQKELTPCAKLDRMPTDALPEPLRTQVLKGFIEHFGGISPGRRQLEQVEQALRGFGEVWLSRELMVVGGASALLLVSR